MVEKKKQIWMLIFTLIIVLILPIPLVQGRLLEKDDHFTYTLSGEKDDKWTVDLLVTKGSEIDVYIISPIEFRNYSNGRPFNASFFLERVTSAFFNWTMPEDHTYYVIIDNENNSRDSDALPEGMVTYYLDVIRNDLRGIGLYNIPPSIEIREGESVYIPITLGGRAGTEYEIGVSVLNDQPVDLYILSEKEFEKYRKNWHFEPTYAHEGVVFNDTIWIQPDGQEYVFIVDNRDNQRISDATPSGNVTCNIEARNKTLYDERIDYDALADMMLVACSIGIVAVIIVIVVLLKMEKQSNNIIIRRPIGITPQRQYLSIQQDPPPQHFQQEPQYPPPPQPPQYPDNQMPPPPPQ